jgi:hypothetical protein
MTYSEDFTNGAWLNAGGIVNGNTTISPDGTQNADTLTGARYKNPVTYFGVYTVSCYAKKVNGDNKFLLRLDVPTLSYAQFDLNTGTVDSVTSGYSATIKDAGNGWYRCTLTTPPSTTIINIVLVSANGGANSTYVWGAQIEASAYPTSYIPTTSTSVTRVADISNTYISSSILPQMEGTIFVQFDWQKAQDDVQIISVHNYSTNLAWVTKNTATEIFCTFFMSGYIGSITSSVASNMGTIKVAYTWENGNQKLYVNGAEVGTASGAITSNPYLNYVKLNGFWGINKNGCMIDEAILFQRVLTNQEAIALTTL